MKKDNDQVERFYIKTFNSNKLFFSMMSLVLIGMLSLAASIVVSNFPFWVAATVWLANAIVIYLLYLWILRKFARFYSNLIGEKKE